MAGSLRLTAARHLTEAPTFNSVSFGGNTTINNLNVTNINPGFIQGSVVFEGSNGLTQDNGNFFYNPSTTQLSLGTNAPEASALLQLDSTSKGFLPPRQTTAQRDAIASPATGLTIYNTDTNQYNVYNGVAWGVMAGGGGGGGGGVELGSAGQFSYYQTSGATVSPQTILNIKNNQIGIGTNTPAALLHVLSSSTTQKTLLVQGSPLQTADIFTVAPSSGAAYFTVGSNGSTTIATLGNGVVKSANGSLYNGLVANSELENSSVTVNASTGSLAAAWRLWAAA